MTIRELISTVRNSVISVKNNRYIYSLLVNYANTFIKRDNDQRRLFKQTHLFKTISCFELEEVSLIDACNILIPNCKKVMRSKEKIPSFYSTIYGGLLEVYSIDGLKRYNNSDPSNYINYLNREFKSKSSGQFWITNDYLIIPDTIEVVMIRGLFSSEAEINKFNKKNVVSCKSKLDELFIVPDYLIGDILKATIADIRNTAVLQENQVPVTN